MGKGVSERGCEWRRVQVGEGVSGGGCERERV